MSAHRFIDGSGGCNEIMRLWLSANSCISVGVLFHACDSFGGFGSQ